MNAQDRKLWRYWHGPRTADDVAACLGTMSGRSVQREWERMRGDGLLPTTPRPHFAECTPANIGEREPFVADGETYVIDRDLDRSFAREAARGDECCIAVPSGDPLLEKLNRVHGTDRRRHVDDNASGMLAALERGHLYPSAATLANCARILDRVMVRVGQ